MLEDNFFVIDSDNLRQIQTRLYGYSFSSDDLILDSRKNFDELLSCGAFIFVDVNDDEISICQDYIGSYGLYYYESEDYFAISNSFLKLMEHLRDNGKYFTFNRDYANYFLSQMLSSNLRFQTLVNEIEMLPENIEVIINKSKKSIKFENAGYREHEVPINSKEALDILDAWYLKWVNVIRSVRATSNSMIFDLSGGFDSRIVASIWINANIDLTKIRIYSKTDKKSEEDFEIATQIAEHFNIPLNNELSYEYRPVSFEESITKSEYVKFGFEKARFLRREYPIEPLFRVSGHCGGVIRNYGTMNAEEYKALIMRGGYNFHPMLRDSCERLINEEMDSLASDFNLDRNSTQLPSLLYQKARNRHHFGKEFVDSFLFNKFTIAPLSDYELQRINYKIGIDDVNMLIALIFKRYCPDLLNFKFDSGRAIDQKTLEACDEINAISPFEMPELDFVEGPEVKKISHDDVELRTHNLKLFKWIVNSNHFQRDFEKYYPTSLYNVVRFEMRKNRRNIRDVTALVEIMKTIHDANNVKSSRDDEFIDWVNKFPLNADNTPEVKSACLLEKYNQARLDIKNFGNKDNKVRIVENSDSTSKYLYPDFIIDDEGRGLVLTASRSSIDLKLQAVNDGVLRIKLRSVQVKDKNKNLLPIFINYINFTVDGESVIEDNVLVTFKDGYVFEMDVKDSQIVDVHLEWQPYSESYEFRYKELESLKDEVKSLKDERSDLKREISELKRELAEINNLNYMKVRNKLKNMR